MRLWEKFKAWRRGERMLEGNRGRVFEKKDPPKGHQAEAKATINLKARVTRKDGTIEEYDLG